MISSIFMDLMINLSTITKMCIYVFYFISVSINSMDVTMQHYIFTNSVFSGWCWCDSAHYLDPD